MRKSTMQQTDWDHFTGQWIATVAILRRDGNYCRLAIAMAAADGQQQPWDHYLDLAARWLGIHDDRAHTSMQRRVEQWRAQGWTISVTPQGRWVAKATGVEVECPRLKELLSRIELSGQPLREEWAAKWALFQERRSAAQA